MFLLGGHGQSRLLLSTRRQGIVQLVCKVDEEENTGQEVNTFFNFVTQKVDMKKILQLESFLGLHDTFHNPFCQGFTAG